MKPLKLNGFHKFVCFVLVSILVVLLLGFAVNGLQLDNTNLPDNSGDVGDKTDNIDENEGDNGENKNQQSSSPNDNKNPSDPTQNDQNSENNTEPPQEEKYINTITGLEISKKESISTPIGAVIDPKAPMYGVSVNDISIEFPIEDGTTRLLTYTTDFDNLWKLGALKPTRNFISSMSGFFGGIVVSYENDDVIIYDAWETDMFTLDISDFTDCYYVENTLYVYTSKNMIELAKAKKSYDYSTFVYNDAPFEFIPEGDSYVGTGTADTVIIPYSDSYETELYYHEKSGQYLYYKSAVRKMDMLTGKNVTFKNVFILFADATTYEKAEGTELVIDIQSGGKGYYISEGQYSEFRWETNKSGELLFCTFAGDKLSVNPGNSYIAYYKSAISSEIVLM